MHGCEKMDKLVDDDSFAVFAVYGEGSPPDCTCYKKCKVVKTPFVVSKMLGAGWMFPRRSPFLPILKHYFGLFKEAGTYNRLKDSHKENKNNHLPDQECFEYDGHPIQMQKAVSLFGLILGGMGLSFIIFL